MNREKFAKLYLELTKLNDLWPDILYDTTLCQSTLSLSLFQQKKFWGDYYTKCQIKKFILDDILFKKFIKYWYLNTIKITSSFFFQSSLINAVSTLSVEDTINCVCEIPPSTITVNTSINLSLIIVKIKTLTQQSSGIWGLHVSSVKYWIKEATNETISKEDF